MGTKSTGKAKKAKGKATGKPSPKKDTKAAEKTSGAALPRTGKIIMSRATLEVLQARAERSGLAIPDQIRELLVALPAETLPAETTHLSVRMDEETQEAWMSYVGGHETPFDALHRRETAIRAEINALPPSAAAMPAGALYSVSEKTYQRLVHDNDPRAARCIPPGRVIVTATDNTNSRKPAPRKAKK